jgi:hypothetical protein
VLKFSTELQLPLVRSTSYSQALLLSHIIQHLDVSYKVVTAVNHKPFYFVR